MPDTLLASTKQGVMSEKEKKDSKKKSTPIRKSANPKAQDDQKKKVEAMLEEESSEEEGVKVTRIGYVEMRTKAGFKAVYALLIGGSFYWMKTSSDPVPKGSVDLKGYVISTEPIKGVKKKFIFSIQKGEDKSAFVGSVSSEAELTAWKKDLTESLEKEHADPPAVEATKKKKQGVMARAKKNVASGAASSALGKKVMKTVINEETSALIHSLKKIVAIESGSSKQAETLEQNIIKIAVKGYLLVDGKKLKGRDLLKADKPLRDAFELMVKVFNGRSRVTQARIDEALQQIVDCLKKAEEIVTNLLAPHLQTANMLRVSKIFSQIADFKFLQNVFSDPKIEDDLDKLIDAMEYYTQFHYHVKD